ncbi:hypothetical protein L2E82_34551 [Cichorium intybus]|uniref:Uncharacterized protein n=1 Tax=Cichorium intybus TaxID=13427 RepID=A0ACB9BMJ9_CICIN|nr:hypothetical protein L2E82_34551 [Cichorium intybus]
MLEDDEQGKIRPTVNYLKYVEKKCKRKFLRGFQWSDGSVSTEFDSDGGACWLVLTVELAGTTYDNSIEYWRWRREAVNSSFYYTKWQKEEK